MRRPTWLPAACILALLGCGPLETRSYTYEAVGKPAPRSVAALYIASTRTLETGWSEELRFDAPYRVSIMLRLPDLERPFQVRSLTYEQDGTTTVAHALGDPPLESEIFDPKSESKQTVVWVPLEKLAFVAGSQLSVKAELHVDGVEPAWVVVERTFEATKEEKTYSGCQRMAMH